VQAAASRQRGQALVELALAAPLLLLLTSGVLAVGRVGRAELDIHQVALNAARAAALAPTREAAVAQGMTQGDTVAAEDGLQGGSFRLVVDANAFARGGSVTAEARDTVAFTGLPLLGWARVTVSGRHTEPVDRYRTLGGGGS
jgi:Flp pilus assembly protein TadG